VPGIVTADIDAPADDHENDDLLATTAVGTRTSEEANA
jgi:hypothetical protein